METDREITKRLPEVSLQSLEIEAEGVKIIKRNKRTHDFMCPLKESYPELQRAKVPTGLTQVCHVELKNKNRYFLTPINQEHIIEPYDKELRVRRTSDLSVVRSINGQNACSTITVCKMIPNKSAVLVGDDEGCIHYADIREGTLDIIDFPQNRGGIADICFINENKFLTVSENRQTSINEIKGKNIISLANHFQESQWIKKITFLNSYNFLSVDSCYSIRLYDLEELKVKKKIFADGSVYAVARQNSNVFTFGGSNDCVTSYDLRANRSIFWYQTQENWTGMITHLSEFTLVFSDWRKFVLADSRKGIIERYMGSGRSGIWDAHTLSSKELIASSSDCHIMKLKVND